MCADNNHELNKNPNTENKELLNNGLISSIPITISVVLGKSMMPINQILKLQQGAIIELNRKLGDLVDLYINDKIIAKGEPVILNNSIVGIKVKKIVK